MMIAFAFWLFAISCCLGGFGTVLSRNPVHSVLWLILAFLSAAGLFVLQGAEFVAVLLVIVYVGAVMVLFLFVVMMLDIDFAKLKADFAHYLPLGLLMGLVILVQLAVAFGDWQIAGGSTALRQVPITADVQNTYALGIAIYDQYVLIFQIAGLILLVAMIGAIMLTMRHRKDIKRQDVLRQMYRDPADAMRMTNPKSGAGL